MADTSAGILSATQLNTLLDSLATVLKNSYSNLGLGSPGESSTTFASLTKTARGAILGDGSTTYGLGNAAFEASIKDALYGFVANSRYDSIFAIRCRAIIQTLESAITSNLPTGLVYTSSSQVHPLDAYLLRLNAANSSVLTTPASAGTLTAGYNAAGGLQTSSSGNCPRVVHTLISSVGDWYESLPSAEATQVAIAGPNNSLSYQIAGNAPSNIGKVAIYRTYTGGAGAPYYLDQIVSSGLTAGSPYPAIIIKNPDSFLRTDFTPPSWLQALQSPETAAIFALAFATANQIPGQSINPLVYASTGQLDPRNIFLHESNQFLGVGNQSQSGVLATQVLGTGLTAGTIATANNSSTNIQGFTGSLSNLQARVISALNAAGTTNVNYNYYAASTGYGNTQTASTGNATFAGTGVGQLATYTITAGRLVVGINTDTTGGGMSSGSYVVEGKSPRTY